MRSKVFPLLLVLLIWGGVTPCYAYNVKGYVRYWENRINKAPTGSSGAYYTEATFQTNRPASGVEIFVRALRGNCYDYLFNCNESDDLLLGSPNASSTGYYSVSGASSGDSIYISHEFCNQMGCVRNDESDYPDTVSIADQVGSGDLTKNYNITCPYDSLNNVQGLCDSQAEVLNYYDAHNRLASILMSMRDVYTRIGSYQVNGNTTTVTVYHPDKPGGTQCGSGHSGFTYNRTQVCIGDTHWDENMVLAHELGHVLMRRLLFAPSDTQCNLSECTGPYGWSTSVNEKCVISEGWADFISGATYFSDYAASPYYFNSTQNLEGDTTKGNSGSLACVSNNASPERCRGNAARFFWDMYDSTTEGDDGNDVHNLTISRIKDIWMLFMAGTSNLRECEEDDDGRNAIDFYSYALVSSINIMNEIEQNCLESQDPN